MKRKSRIKPQQRKRQQSKLERKNPPCVGTGGFGGSGGAGWGVAAELIRASFNDKIKDFMMNKLCEDCVFFRKNQKGVRSSDSDGTTGQCFLRPPVATLLPGPPDMTGHPTIQALAVRPSVQPDDFCSSFEKSYAVALCDGPKGIDLN